MSTYVIGDVQGCFNELRSLLHSVGFKPHQDRLWFTGDLVNRGQQSLDVLHFVTDLKDPVVVLGNHDLHLLCLAKSYTTVARDHTLDAVLNSPDCDALIDWLRQRPMLHHDIEQDVVMIHAGLPPQWDLALAKQLAGEVECQLRGEEYAELLRHMYGDQPDRWDDALSGWDRSRFIINALTRIRYCTPDGRLELTIKAPPNQQPHGCIPWFQVSNRANKGLKLIFGHWASLGGRVNDPNLFALDTGCIWGGSLTALRLEDERLFCVKCGT